MSQFVVEHVRDKFIVREHGISKINTSFSLDILNNDD